MEIKKIVTAGFAMFAMLFGAGNVIFPLILGRDMGTQMWYGLAGFLLTAVLAPVLGLLSTLMSDGNYEKFLEPLGKVPAFLITLVCMALIGPFALTPRCVAISYAAIKMHMPSLSLLLFSVICAGIIFAATMRRSAIVDLLGKYLGPLKLTLLLGIVAKGLFMPAAFVQVGFSSLQGFIAGLEAGYGPCDLLATVFLAALILSGLRKGMSAEEEQNPKNLLRWGIEVGALGAVLLGLVYAGFCVVAGYYGQMLVGVERGDIFSTLAVLILGEQGGFLANITVAISCLTTAIALTTVFAEYLKHGVFQDRIDYVTSLLITVAITTCMANLGFAGIMSVLSPIIKVIYPALCMFAVTNIMHKLWGFRYIKAPAAIVFLYALASSVGLV